LVSGITIGPLKAALRKRLLESRLWSVVGGTLIVFKPLAIEFVMWQPKLPVSLIIYVEDSFL